ncbi:MAG: acyl-CoA thioesterase [Bacteroidetes bacterium]|jgi:acyl-CoA thioester hydrolase|nr:acyl-CoA thioesterase [Bacteroidota bacterium]
MADRTPVFTAQIPVRWGDMDAMGHVNNSRFFTYFEQARLEWLETLAPDDWRQGSTGPILASAKCDFKRPVVYPATLDIAISVGALGRTSLPTFYVVRVEHEDETVVATGEATLVWIDYATGQPVPLPEALRTALTAQSE